MQTPGRETELWAFFTQARVFFLRPELEFILAHSRLPYTLLLLLLLLFTIIIIIIIIIMLR